MNNGRSRLSSARAGSGALAAVLLTLGAAACGGESELSELAQRGRQTANSNGCASCHGANGQGGVGPTWIDLAGSERLLVDGTTVIADDDYLLRSILEPAAEIAAAGPDGATYTLQMPTNGLSEAEAADVIAYIEELTSDDDE